MSNMSDHLMNVTPIITGISVSIATNSGKICGTLASNKCYLFTVFVLGSWVLSACVIKARLHVKTDTEPVVTSITVEMP